MKLHPGSSLRRLTDNFPLAGRIEWIGVRPQPRAAMTEISTVEARVDRGLTGDYRAQRPGSRRQVTLIQCEHLDVVGALLGHDAIRPHQARRNLVVSGINVLALKDETFKIGEVVLEGTGVCQPCSKMEASLGSGGYNALRGHGGITARIIAGGVIRVGDALTVDTENEELAAADRAAALSARS